MAKIIKTRARQIYTKTLICGIDYVLNQYVWRACLCLAMQNSAGHEFKKLMRENYPESYEIMINKEKFQRFVEETKEVLRKSGVKVLQFVVHYSKYEGVNLNQN